jgi:hypothetical protein
LKEWLYNYHSIGINRDIPNDSKKYLYEVKSLELSNNYTTGNIERISKKELNDGIIGNSSYSFDNIFTVIENTLKTSNKTCLAMHHYELNGEAKQLVGLFINDRSNFITMINPKITSKSIKDIIQVKYGNKVINRYKYIFVSFYYDLLYENKANSMYYINEKTIIVNKPSLSETSFFEKIYNVFDKNHLKKKRFVKFEKRFHNEYSVCLQTVIEEFNK